MEKSTWNFLFQYRVTPHAVTGVSPAELLMGRKLRDTLNSPKTTEAYWQQLLSERDSSAKLHQKEYADKTRGANTEKSRRATKCY